MSGSRHSIRIALAGLIAALGLIGCVSNQRQAASSKADAISELITLADMDRGRSLFLSNEATACAACHTFQGRGARIGPDLTDVRRRLSPEEIFDSIRAPNQKIAEGYQMVMITTEEEVIFGRLLSQSPKDVRLGLGDDTTVQVPRAVIEESELLPTLMPEYTDQHLSDGDVRDLVAFLVLSEASSMPAQVAEAEPDVVTKDAEVWPTERE